MGKHEILDQALSWKRIINQGGAGPELSWEREIWDNELEDAAASPGLLCPALSVKHSGFQAGHGTGVTKDPWKCSPRIPGLGPTSLFQQGLIFLQAQLCCGSTAGCDQGSILVRSKPNIDKT